MIKGFLLRIKFVALLLIIFTVVTNAQPALPDMQFSSDKGVNILSWTCQYDGVKFIAVQRSKDSVYNFTTIGYVNNLKKGLQGFVDGHPNPGVNWYRLYIAFSSDLTWYSNRVKLNVDSAQLLQQMVLPPNDSLQKMLNTTTFKIDPNASKVVVGGLNKISNPKIKNDVTEYTYVRSQYVFTNPFTGHINVELPDSDDKRSIFSLFFYDLKNKKVLEIDKIPLHSIVIDKRNFEQKGIYRFELKKSGETIENGHVTIY